MQREQLHSRRQLRRLRKQAFHLFRKDRLHISDFASTQHGKCLGSKAECNFVFVLGHCSSPTLTQLFAEILIRRTDLTVSGRSRSTDNSPSRKSAFVTCMPSASTNVR